MYKLHCELQTGDGTFERIKEHESNLHCYCFKQSNKFDLF